MKNDDMMALRLPPAVIISRRFTKRLYNMVRIYDASFTIACFIDAIAADDVADAAATLMPFAFRRHYFDAAALRHFSGC